MSLLQLLLYKCFELKIILRFNWHNLGFRKYILSPFVVFFFLNIALDQETLNSRYCQIWPSYICGCLKHLENPSFGKTFLLKSLILL